MLIIEIAEWVMALFMIGCSILAAGVGMFLLSLSIFAAKDWLGK
jgi:hypothetical protein